MKKIKKDILDNQISEDKDEKDKNMQENYFLKQKRKDPFESDEEEELGENKNDGGDINHCQYCNVKINFKTDIDTNFNEKNMLENLIKIIFENNKEINNIFSDTLNDIFNKDIENKKLIIFFKKIQNYCNLCIQKIFIKGGISNLYLIIKNNIIENNKKDNYLKLVLSKNNLLEDKINEIANDLNNIIKKQYKNKKDVKLVNQINDKIEENIDKLIEIKNILGKINQKSNITKIEKESLNNFNNIIKLENTEISETNSDIEEKQKEIYKISDKNNITCQSTLKEKSNKVKKYTILTKRFIYESNYEKNKSSKIFQYNSMNQFKNYLQNFPILLNKASNNIDDDINEKNIIINNNNLINSLSDIKSLENTSNLKKSRINPIINPLNIPFRNLSQEVEKKISKLKQNDTANNKTNILDKDYNIENENENIINKKYINRNNELNKKKINNENYNNNNLENDISNKNLLLKYLISSYQVNQKLLNQINLGINPLNSIISGINNNNLINDLINSKSFEANLNNNIPNSINNPINNPIINNFPNINNLNPFGNNINDNLNILNNMQSFYNPNLMNNNFGLPLNIFNDLPGLKNSNFENFNLFPNNSQNQIPFQDKFNFINKDLNSIISGKSNNIQDINSFQINNINKNENEKIKKENKNNDTFSENEFEENDKIENKNKN